MTSDYFESRKKLVQGNNWRGEITIEIDGDEYNWTVRQMEDDEYFDVISDIDRDAIQEFRDEVDEDKLEEYRELQDERKELRNKRDGDDDNLTDDEQERLDEVDERVGELREELEDADILDRIDQETFEAIRRAGRYGVVPGEDDVDYVMGLTFDRQEELFGRKIQSRDEAETAIKDDMTQVLENATDFVSFEVGLQVLQKTMQPEEDEGN